MTNQFVFRQRSTVYSENKTPINTFCEQKCELFNVETDDTHSYHCMLKNEIALLIINLFL